jgi:Mycothiol maleylpyruvate isomerase N-terminal domain
MGRREELLREEAEGWGRLTEIVDALTSADLERADVTPDGWAVRDVLWHIAMWSRDTARALREMDAGTWDGTDPSLEPGWTDRVNAEWFSRSRVIPIAEVMETFPAARRDLLDAFGTLDELTPDADEWFEETGPIHYAKHLADLRTWLDRARTET